MVIMKSIHKTLLLVLVGLLIVPQVTFAAWWNPFTWNIFNRAKAPQVEVQKTAQPSEIEKLRNEVEELKKKTNTSVVTPPKSPTSPTSVSKSTTQPTAPSV